MPLIYKCCKNYTTCLFLFWHAASGPAWPFWSHIDPSRHPGSKRECDAIESSVHFIEHHSWITIGKWGVAGCITVGFKGLIPHFSLMTCCCLKAVPIAIWPVIRYVLISILFEKQKMAPLENLSSSSIIPCVWTQFLKFTVLCLFVFTIGCSSFYASVKKNF